MTTKEVADRLGVAVTSLLAGMGVVADITFKDVSVPASKEAIYEGAREVMLMTGIILHGAGIDPRRLTQAAPPDLIVPQKGLIVPE